MGTVRRAPVAAPALLQTSQTWKEKERSAPARPHANWKWRHRENLKNWRYVIGRTVIAEQGGAQSNGNWHVPEAYFEPQLSVLSAILACALSRCRPLKLQSQLHYHHAPGRADQRFVNWM